MKICNNFINNLLAMFTILILSIRWTLLERLNSNFIAISTAKGLNAIQDIATSIKQGNVQAR